MDKKFLFPPQNKIIKNANLFMFMVTPTGLEPVASRLGISRSILMSYGAIFIITSLPKGNRYLSPNIYIEQTKIAK